VFGLLKQYGPPAEASRQRYLIGLVMFTIPTQFGWVGPYVAHLIPGYSGNDLVFAIAGDLILLASLFVLDDDFWDKLRVLFFHQVKAVYPESDASKDAGCLTLTTTFSNDVPTQA